MSFIDVLNLSVSASFLVLAVVLFRLVLRKAPKALHCALWALVAFRLLCPVSIESDMSLIPTRELLPREYLMMEPRDDGFETPARLELVTNPNYEMPLSLQIAPTVDRVQHWDVLATIIWATGMGAMGIYALYSYLSLRLRVRMAANIHSNVWECDDLQSPFILGLIRPRIYLPPELGEATRAHVLAHERAHLKRLDHLWKPLGFALLTIHWFNPVMWLAYALLCRDIELACDEKVIRHLDKPAVRAYSESLIRCTVPHRSVALCPLAFGEVGVKDRIRAMVRYKKPGAVLTCLSLIASVLLAACFVTDPQITPSGIDELLSRSDCHVFSIEEQSLTLEIRKAALPENVLNGKTHRFDDAPIFLLEVQDTTLSITEARMSGDELLVTIAMDHRLREDGTVLLPYHPQNDSPDSYVRLAGPDVEDPGNVYPNAAILRGMGPDSFSMGIKIKVWDQASEYVRFRVEGLSALTYGVGYRTEPTQFTYAVSDSGEILELSDEELIPLLIEIICNTPTAASNPGAFIEAHPEEYARLVELGQMTVDYSFRQFAKGNGMSLRGHIMAIACREIIGKTEDVYPDGTYMTAQAWFNTFAAKADALYMANGEDALRQELPYHAQALEALGII